MLLGFRRYLQFVPLVLHVIFNLHMVRTKQSSISRRFTPFHQNSVFPLNFSVYFLSFYKDTYFLCSIFILFIYEKSF